MSAVGPAKVDEATAMISKLLFATEAQSSEGWRFGIRKTEALAPCLCASVAKHPIIAAGRFDRLKAPSPVEGLVEPALPPSMHLIREIRVIRG